MNTSNHFPKTSRVKEEIFELGVKAAKELYNVHDLSKHINNVFKNEYDAYISTNTYFPGCPSKIYQANYSKRLSDYCEKYPDADEFDFLKEEDSLIDWLLQMSNENKNNFYEFYPYLKPDPHRKNISLSLSKTRELIDTRIHELGHFFIIPGVDPVDWGNAPRFMLEPERNQDVGLNKIYPETLTQEVNGGMQKEGRVAQGTDNKQPAWFEIGILFATGEMDQYLNESWSDAKSPLSFNDIAKKISFPTNRPYISSSVNGNISDKNIFSCPKKMNAIRDYCIENNISICENFKKKYNLLLPE